MRAPANKSHFVMPVIQTDRQKEVGKMVQADWNMSSVVMQRCAFSLDETHPSLIPGKAAEFLRFETWEDTLVGGCSMEGRRGSFRERRKNGGEGEKSRPLLFCSRHQLRISSVCCSRHQRQ